MTLTREQKAELGWLLKNKAGDLLEFWSEARSEPLADVDADEARAQLATWLRRLPGDWDNRLGE